MENCSTLNQNMDLDDAFLDSIFESKNRSGTPTELIEAAEGATKKLLPSKSLERYQQVYDQFEEWKKLKQTTSNSERVLLAYFTELSEVKKLASSSLWAKYSMLKKTININAKVDISSYASLTAYLKVLSHDYQPKQAKVFTEEQVQRFLDTAPDDLWLDVKVTSLFNFFPHFRGIFSYLTSLFCFSVTAGSLCIWCNGCVPYSRTSEHSYGSHHTVRRHVLRVDSESIDENENS